MAEQTQTTFDSLREELGKLAAQVQNFVSSQEHKKSDESREMMDKLMKEVSGLKQTVSEQAQRVYSAGQSGVEEVGEYARRNPVTSLLIAFGAGCVFSCLLRHLTK
ncbi:MAG: hypothetical protein K2H64_06625 [Desulfovibrio sp.]|nr:hypothetical protein [Desulfovibrio sp.]